MAALYGWIQNIVYYLIFVTMVINLLPAGKYEKYLRLFAGCIFILLVIQPVTGGLRLEDKIDGIFRTLSFENEAGELKTDLEGMEKRRMEELVKRYEEAASEDVKRMAEAGGFENPEVSVEINREEQSSCFGQVKRVTVSLGSSRKERKETGAVEPIEKVTIGKPYKEDGPPSSKVSAPGMAADGKAEELRREIASCYQVEEQYVEIRLEDE